MKTKPRKPSGRRRPAASPRTGPVAARPSRDLTIVGIGASAGGLEAFTQLLGQLPLDTHFGFVLVQHLDPMHESALSQLLARATAMPVREATNNLRVEANHVYIIPPNTSLGIEQGVLKLQPRVNNRIPPRSIDCFFEALANDQHERTIGVILSGTATDGTLGLEAIKAAGGLTFAQDDSARYNSMPRSAVDAGCVDFVLSPGAIARELARIARHPFVAGGTRRDETPLPARSRGRNGAKAGNRSGVSAGARTEGEPGGISKQSGYQKILLLLRNHSGVDFSLYKTTTIHRRMTRRAVLNRRDTLENYATFLRGNPKELDALYVDSLISVTSFFRNADAFAVLKQKVLARLLQQRTSEPLRVWVLGCSTGQEAYSIAIAFAECAGKVRRARRLQVFATDLNEANLDKARQGLYAKTLAQDVSPERLRRFFIEEEGGYRVIKSLREQVVFARHNLISDPPFSRMDLISCRNLMIYLEPSLQKKALPAFHYALKPEGFLFLGASESIGGFTGLFAPVDKKQKIFARKNVPTLALHLPLRKVPGPRTLTVPLARAVPGGRGGAAEIPRGELNAEREADRVTVNHFAPPSVLINADLQILQFRGPTGAFLEPPTGKASFDLLKMAREGLMLPLRAAIHRAMKENRTVRAEGVPIVQNGKTRPVNVEVVPLKNLKDRRLLVLFEDAERGGNLLPPAPPDGAARPAAPLSKRQESSRVAGLEQDLAETRDYLQSVQEHQEAANEELQASNEEGQSANEELQSLNEELETSKEELESTNEELTTVNEELASRNSELNRLNSDLTNLETSTKLVVVLLGRDLGIRRYSVQAAKQFGLSASDLGRTIGGLRHNLRLPGLDAIIAEVILSVRECEREIQDHDGRWYSLRVRPYVSLDNKVDGAVLVLMDVDALKRTERLITEEHEHAEAIIRTVPNPLVILSADLCLQSANDAFHRTFKITAAALRGRSLFEVDRGTWDLAALRELLEDIIPHNGSFDDFEMTQNFPRIGRRHLLLNARTLNESGGKPKEILLGIQDVTARREAESALRLVQAELAVHTSQLERLVAKRTVDLTATNRRLAAAVDVNLRGKEQYRALLAESLVAAQKLRQLTRQIISVQEDERKEISRELHDEVVQTLVGINVELAALGHHSASDRRGLRTTINRTQRLVANSVNAVHRFARDLRPAVLDDLGLIPALHAYCKQLAERKNLKIQLTAFAGVEALDGAKRIVLFRVAQEALTNVTRHAQATQARLQISKIPGGIRMEISDNGRSFPVAKTLLAKNNKRLGLLGMRERVEMIGGKFSIESAPGQGTTVRAELPLTSEKSKS